LRKLAVRKCGKQEKFCENCVRKIYNHLLRNA
jgi:hypothetical protein